MNQLEKHFTALVGVTEASALACFPFIGKKDSYEADRVAVNAMRSSFKKLPIDVRIAIGEGERDKAPRLYTGEKLGDSSSSLKIDVAVDPLEGTTLCAYGKAGSLSVMAIALRDNLFMAPDVYMDKIACGKEAKDKIDLKAPVQNNIKEVAQALGKSQKEIKVGVLDRPRHKDLISDILKTGASVSLVEDGDVALALNTAFSSPSLDLLMGIGGAPEGVLAASGLKNLAGGFQGQFIFKDKEEEERALKVGMKNLNQVWERDELVKGETLFCATGVTSGDLVEGIKKEADYFLTQSLILAPFSQKKINSKKEKFEN